MSIKKQIWDHLIAQGMTPHGAAGLMGNLYAESGLIPGRVEMLCLKRLREHGKNYTDETYTAAVDSGKISKEEFLHPLPGRQYGYGLAQWTSPGRKGALYDFVKAAGVSIADAGAQLDYLVYELNTSYKSVLNVLKTAKTVKEASDIVLVKYEAPANCGASVKATRASYGQKYYDKYAKGDNTMSCTPDKVIAIAKGEDGYLEKRSNSQLDSKTANAGSSNYTKYWRDLANWGLGNYQAQYWCAAFVHWCFVKAFGLAAAKKLLLHAPYISCDTLASKSKAAGRRYTTPKVGDVVVFWNGSRYSHTGLVYKVSCGYFYTIEGNTSGASGVISNGGGVVVGKRYEIAGTSHRFHRPAYASATNGNTTATGNSVIAAGQMHANNFCGANLAISGERDAKTKKAGIMVLQTAMNLDYCAGLEVDGIWGPKSDAELKGHYVKLGETQYMVTALEILFMLRGIECGGVESPGVFGEGLEDAVKDYKTDKGWKVNGTAGAGTFKSLMGV